MPCGICTRLCHTAISQTIRWRRTWTLYGMACVCMRKKRRYGSSQNPFTCNMCYFIGSTRKRSARADHSFIIRFRNRSGGNHLLKRYWKSITGVPGRWLMKRGMTAHYLRCPSGKEGTAGAERSPSLRSMS